MGETGGYGVDNNYLVRCVGYVCNGSVAVNGDHSSFHTSSVTRLCVNRAGLTPPAVKERSLYTKSGGSGNGFLGEVIESGQRDRRL